MKATKLFISLSIFALALNVNAQNDRNKGRQEVSKSKNSELSSARNSQVRQGENNRKIISTQPSAGRNSQHTSVSRVQPNNNQPSRGVTSPTSQQNRGIVVNQNRNRAVQKDARRYQKNGYDYGVDNFGRNYPTIGINIDILPGNPRQLRVNSNLFFEVRGVFYTQIGKTQRYQVVRPPVGAVVYDLPVYAQEVVIDGYLYYQYGDVYYAAIVLDNGYMAYEVVG